MKYFLVFLLWSYFFIDVFARAWGGWGSSWSGWWDGVAFIIAILFYAIYHIRRKKLLKKAQKDLQEALLQDSSWNIEWLKQVTRDTFMRYQSAWMDKDISWLRHLMTKYYHEKASKVMQKQLNGKKNILKNIKIHQMNLISVKDKLGRDGDMFAMEVVASMIDYTVDENTWNFVSSTLSRGKNESRSRYESRAKKQWERFTEYWVFMRYNNTWRLNNIKQKMSIIRDIIWLSQAELLLVLKKEKFSQDVDDSSFYSVEDSQNI